MLLIIVNETSSTDNSIIKLGIVTIENESQQSNLIIPGYSLYNDTIVRCNAIGFVNGSMSYYNFIESTLRIQVNTLSDICHYISPLIR